MDDNHFLDSDMLNIQKERPTFLTVLTIITFVISGIMLLSSLYGMFTFNELDAKNQLEITIANSESTSASLPAWAIDLQEDSYILMEESIEKNTIFSWFGLLSCLLSLVGAYLMYNMKKVGFHAYVISKFVGLIPLAFVTISFGVTLTYGFIIFFSLAFVIMYAVNLKHFKN